MKLNAKWTNDCQGKQDYDGDILSISTRYYPGPGGGGFLAVETGPEGAKMWTEPYGPRPQAHSSLLLWDLDSDEDGKELAEASFEADTEAEVKAQVEAWAQEQMGRAVKALLAEFSDA